MMILTIMAIFSLQAPLYAQANDLSGDFDAKLQESTLCIPEDVSHTLMISRGIEKRLETTVTLIKTACDGTVFIKTANGFKCKFSDRDNTALCAGPDNQIVEIPVSKHDVVDKIN